VVLCHPICAAVHTYLKQPWQPLLVFTLSQSLFRLCSSPILTYSRALSALGIFIHPLHCATALYLPKTAFAALSNLQSEDLAL
jgi:hypothetical protein